MDHINLVETFSEFKEFKNIDRETMMLILEDIFRHMLIKKYGSDENINIIVNIDKGDLEIWRNRQIVDDGQRICNGPHDASTSPCIRCSGIVWRRNAEEHSKRALHSVPSSCTSYTSNARLPAYLRATFQV